MHGSYQTSILQIKILVGEEYCTSTTGNNEVDLPVRVDVWVRTDVCYLAI